MEGNDKLEELRADILTNTDKAGAVAQEIGIEGDAGAGPPDRG